MTTECKQPKVKAVYYWQNGMAMVFGQDGHQITELQGKASPELRAKIKLHSDADTEVHENCIWKVPQ